MTEHEERPRMNGSDEPAEMSTPHAIETRASRVRWIVAGLVALLVFGSVPAVGLSRFASADEDKLKESKLDLHETKDEVRARTRKIRTLQRRLNRLATRIARTEADVIETERHLDKLERKTMVLRARAALLQAKLDERSREAYMSGGAPILYLLTATSAADAAARMSFLTEMNRRDGVLAGKVRDAEDRLGRVEAELVRGRQILELSKQRLQADRRTLRRKMAESRRLIAELHERVEQIQYEISRIRPFAVCPVAGPHAIADGFGILHHHSKKEGGTHIHQGNDISAAMGTPIVAPFDGVAVTTSNEIGGLAVQVLGEFGFVYNAHLSRLGQLGSVERGDVIGYVGETGNATGPHVHFEWHPGGGSAVDPYDFLLLVCA
jgi:murein DD-endopeptidase MepM/ murein hydrolase activator NlpD